MRLRILSTKQLSKQLEQAPSRATTGLLRLTFGVSCRRFKTLTGFSESRSSCCLNAWASVQDMNSTARKERTLPDTEPQSVPLHTSFDGTRPSNATHAQAYHERPWNLGTTSCNQAKIKIQMRRSGSACPTVKRIKALDRQL